MSRRASKPSTASSSCALAPCPYPSGQTWSEPNPSRLRCRRRILSLPPGKSPRLPPPRIGETASAPEMSPPQAASVARVSEAEVSSVALGHGRVAFSALRDRPRVAQSLQSKSDTGTHTKHVLARSLSSPACVNVWKSLC